MLKDFKYSSHVICAKNIEKLTNNEIVIEKLEVAPHSDVGDEGTRIRRDDDDDKDIRVRRDGGRHQAPSPLDMRDIMSPDIYHRYDLIVDYLKVFTRHFLHPNKTLSDCDMFQDIATRHSFVELLELGRSHEDRSILGVKVGRSPLGRDTPSLVLDGGMHAREWITVATALNCEHLGPATWRQYHD